MTCNQAEYELHAEYSLEDMIAFLLSVITHRETKQKD